MTAAATAGDTAIRELPRVETLTWGFAPPVVAIVRARYPDLTSKELALFLYEAYRLELDPGALGQVYAILYNKDKPDKRSLSIQIGIPGFRAIAAKTGLLNGSANVEDGPEETTTYKADNGRQTTITHPAWCRATVYRKGADFPFTATVRWAERVKLVWGLPTEFWRDQPYGMLEKAAESMALRKAFPAETHGLTLEGEREDPHPGAVEVETRTPPDTPSVPLPAVPPPPPVLPAAPDSGELQAVQAEIRGLMDNSPDLVRLRMSALLNNRLDLLRIRQLGDAAPAHLPGLKALRDDLHETVRSG